MKHRCTELLLNAEFLSQVNVVMTSLCT